MLTLNEALARARSMVGKKTKYKLGSGGILPGATSPVNVNGECDCSGFISWALGMSRKTDHPTYVQFNGGWINTDAIVQDADHDTGFFSRINLPRVGALVVYPARKKSGKTIVGHVGIIDSVAANGAIRVIHCSSTNSKKGDAIQETDDTVFKANPKSIYAWFAGF
jgi:cell wall-associated NlpC family hydrolase